MKKIINVFFTICLLTSCSNVSKGNISSSQIIEESSSSLEESLSSIEDSSTTIEESSTSIEESSPVEESTTIEESSSSVVSESESSSPSIENTKAKNITNYVSDEGGIPLINIYTDEKAPITSKTNYVSGYLNIVSQPDTSDVLLKDTTMGIRLRGNSTIAPEKKAYRIKFTKKQSLFGLPKAKSWVLLANYFDKSNIRNYLAYLMANKLDNLEFQPSSIMCEVNVNDEYRGLYLLCEQMQTGEGRVDIEGKVDSHGYSSFFVEADDEGRIQEDGGVLNQTYVKINGTCFNIKYPEGDELTSEMVEFIRVTLQCYKDSMKTHKHIEQNIDIDSFIDAYFIQELFKNPDCNGLSLYYYYDTDTDLVKAGPVWDFDLGLDAVGIDVYQGYKNSKLWACTANYDYAVLYKYKKSLIKQRYKEVRDILYSVLDEFEIVKEYLEEPQERNAKKWAIPGDCSAWVAQRYDKEYKSLKTVDAHYEYLKTKLTNQLGYMDEAYNN